MSPVHRASATDPVRRMLATTAVLVASAIVGVMSLPDPVRAGAPTATGTARAESSTQPAAEPASSPAAATAPKSSKPVVAQPLPLAPDPVAAALGLRLAPGFRIQVVADHDLTPDLYSMVVDHAGRIVVSSAGWIRRLHDDDGDGKADRTEDLGRMDSGAFGLAFDDDGSLLAVGDGGLFRYGSGGKDARREKLLDVGGMGEHGGHHPRRGPDGWWYVTGGNDSGFDARYARTPDSPVTRPAPGAVLRVSADFRQCEIFASGFRNPYRSDFDSAGDLFTWDSDTERDFHLPWYNPTRIERVGRGLHMGWRLPGYMRTWTLPQHSPETPRWVADMGRGSPTGVAVYRHVRFPAKYRDGVFAADWTFGRVWFVPKGDPATDGTMKPEVLLEPTGTGGFAPTDLAVGPDGSLLVCIGGRRTRGGVFRITWAGGHEPGGKPSTAQRFPPLQQVLTAPQPLDAWSRAKWIPAAEKLGAAAFREAVLDDRLPAAWRVRAVEVLTERFDGLGPSAVRAAAVGSDEVRARVAWSLGRRQSDRAEAARLLVGLASDPTARVRHRALEGLADLASTTEPSLLVRALGPNLADGDKHVRLAAQVLAVRLSEADFALVREAAARAGGRAALTVAVADVLRVPVGTPVPGSVRTGCAIVRSLSADKAADKERHGGLLAEALRLIVAGLGGENLHKSSAEVFTGVSLAVEPSKELRDEVLAAVRPWVDSPVPEVGPEAIRLAAMLRDDEPSTAAKVAARITDKSPAADDVHALIALARLQRVGAADAGRLAGALLSLDGKLAGGQSRVKQNWNDRMAELVGEFLRQDPALADRIVGHPKFVSPAHVGYAALLKGPQRVRAAELLAAKAAEDEEFPWSEPLLDLLAVLPPTKVKPLLRGAWSNLGVRDRSAILLAAEPAETDRARFVQALESPSPRTLTAAVGALQALGVPAGASGGRDGEAARGEAVALLRLLRRLCSEPAQGGLRGQVLELAAARVTGLPGVTEPPVRPVTTSPAGKSARPVQDPVEIAAAYRPVFEEFARRHPAEAKRLADDGGEDPAAWAARFARIDWSAGSAKRGAQQFVRFACQTCHAGAKPLGPDVAATARRFGRDDLLAAIVFPHRDVAPLYRTTLFRMKDGTVHNGIVVFFSADGVIVQTGATTTIRLAGDEISEQRPSTQSLMPSGLLREAADADIADLYAYLRELAGLPADTTRPAATPAAGSGAAPVPPAPVSPTTKPAPDSPPQPGRAPPATTTTAAPKAAPKSAGPPPDAAMLAAEKMIEASLALAAADLGKALPADVTTAEEWTARRPKLQAEFRAMMSLDPLPARGSLNPVVVGTIDRGTYVIERLHFQSIPRLYVTANLYRPKTVDKPLPTVLYVCGHGRNPSGNKAAYQLHGHWFATHGYVCLIIDTNELGELGAGREHHGTHSQNKWWWHATGYTPGGVETWNAMRALDYLETRPEVDRNRFGVTGRSGGGAMTWALAALDDRIKVAAGVAGITDMRSHVVDKLVNGHCDCMYFTNTHRWDFGRVAALCAPRPTLLGNSDRDPIFPIPGYRAVHADAMTVFKLHGAGDRFGLLETEGVHKDTTALREPTFAFFNRHLAGGSGDRVDETGLEKLRIPDADLRVFEPGKEPADALNRTIDEAWVPMPADVNAGNVGGLLRWRDRMRERLRRETFGGMPPRRRTPDGHDLAPEAELSALREADARDAEARKLAAGGAHVVRRVVLRTEAALTVTGLLIEAKGADGRPAAAARVRLEVVDEGSSIGQRLADLGGRVPEGVSRWLLLEPRGVGEGSWPPAAVTAIKRRHALVGRTVDGMRVWDVAGAVDWLRSHYGADTTVDLHGAGKAAWIAAFAAIQSPVTAKLTVTMERPPVRPLDAPPLLNLLRQMTPITALGLIGDREHTVITDEPAAFDRHRTVVGQMGGKLTIRRVDGPR